MNPHLEPSDAELDEPGLSALYRQGATQTPPAELDRRILDQAQAALKSRPGSEPSRWPRGWNRLARWPSYRSEPWSWRRLAIPLSSAAGILLALGLVLRVLDEPGAMRGAVPDAVQSMVPGAVPGAMRGAVQGLMPGDVKGLTDMASPPLAEYQSSGPSQLSQPASPSRPAGSSGPSEPFQPARPERGIAAKRASEEATGSISTRALEEVKGFSAGAGLSRPPSPAPAAALGAGAPAPNSAKTPVQLQAQSRDQTEDQLEAQERGPAMPITEGAGDMQLKSRISDEMPQVAPERWLEDIRQKWSSGERAEAIRQLAAFRKVHPAYPLPKDLTSLLGAE